MNKFTPMKTFFNFRMFPIHRDLRNVEVLLTEQSEDQFDSKEKRRVEMLNIPMFLIFVFILI